MISPHSTDAESYETTLALLARVAPALELTARSRAAWAVATAKLDLKAALAAEGHSLHDVRVAAPAAPNGQLTPAQVAELVAIKAEIAVLRGSSSPASIADVNFPVEADHVGAFPQGYDSKKMAVHKAAIALMSVSTGLKYAAAVLAVTRRTA